MSASANATATPDVAETAARTQRAGRVATIAIMLSRTGEKTKAHQ
jgi:hypothetical protein